ncbi:VG15 protein [Nocardia asiatica]
MENRTDPRVIAQVSERLSATLTRHAAEAGRNAVVNAALGAGDEVGWARVLSGAENCPFCAMLASRGPVYRSDKSALTVVGRGGRPRGSRALGERYHDNCDCEAVLVRRGVDWEGREEFERLERLWIAASTAGDQANEEPRRVFNRAFRRIEREPELGEEIEKLWADSTEGLSGSAAITAFTAAIKENPPAALATARRPRRAAE